MTDHDEMSTTVTERRRAPDLLNLVVGILTLAMALAAFTGVVPDLSGVDPRWVFAAGTGLVGVLLLAGTLRRRR